MKWKHNGMDITIEESSGNFNVAELERRYDTLQKARDAIDRHAKESSKSAAKNLALKCLGEGKKGAAYSEFTITGLHAGHHHFLTKPVLDRYRGLYADTPTVRSLLKQIHELRDALGKCEERLAGYKIEDVSYRAATYDEKVELIEKSHANAVAKG